MNQQITIWKEPKNNILNKIDFSLWYGSATGDIYLSITAMDLEGEYYKDCSSRLSGEFSPDSHNALPALYALFNDTWKEAKVEIWSKWKIALDMNNYQKYEAKKDYRMILEKTSYGILIKLFYNIWNMERAHEAKYNTPEREDSITIHAIKKSEEQLHDILQFDRQTMLYLEEKEFKMLEYLIAQLPYKTEK